VSTIVIICGVYFFVLLGFVAKRIFSEIDERTLVLLSVYFLQPMLAFWGILGKKMEINDFFAPALYLAISVIGSVAGFVLFSRFFNDKKDVAIITAAGVIGNTGNLGIPLLVGLFGKEAAFYAVLINTANVFVLYVVGVFLYSMGNFTTKEAVKNIVSIPVIWFSLGAILLNFAGVTLNASVTKIVEMGAHTSMVIQLVIFGVFMAGLGRVSVEKKTLIFAMVNKFVFMPLIAFAVLLFSDASSFIKTIVFLQVCMPLAVSNVNLASLYGCKPYTVTALILVSAGLFLALIFPFMRVF